VPVVTLPLHDYYPYSD